MKTILALYLLSALSLRADVKIETASTLPPGTKGVEYHLALQLSDGRTPYLWSVRSGSLPPGMTMNGGHLGGMPTRAGTYSFKLRVRDGRDDSDTRTFNLTIAPASVSIPPTVPPTTPALLPPGAFIVVPYNASNAVPWIHVDGYGRTNYADGYLLTTNRLYEVQFSDTALGTNWQTVKGNGAWFHQFQTSTRPEPLGINAMGMRMQGWAFHWSVIGGRKFRIVDWTDSLVKPCPFLTIYHGCYE